jgi:predicted amidohydrolase
MSTLRVALLQMASFGVDQDANLAKGEAFCRHARQMGADIALFPEMWNIGYTGYAVEGDGPESDIWREPGRWAEGEENPFKALSAERERWQARAISRDNAYVAHFRGLAHELEMAIAVTYLEQWPNAGAPRNSMSLIDRHGALILTYAKVHTCDFGVNEAALTPGDDFFVAELDTTLGPVQIGAMICYDREFPESARVLMLKGAEIILVPNACEMERHRIAQLEVRAMENMVGVALANYAAPQENGHSIAFDPIAFDKNGPRNMLVIEAGEAEGVYLASFDLEALRDYRRREAWGNAFRRPHRYNVLTSLDVQPPFVRVDEDGKRYQQDKR